MSAQGVYNTPGISGIFVLSGSWQYQRLQGKKGPAADNQRRRILWCQTLAVGKQWNIRRSLYI